MTLRWTILGLILLTLLGLVAVVTVTLQANLGPLFSQQEQQLALSTMGRVRQSFDERYGLLENTALSLSHNDAVYTLVRSGSTDVRESGFVPERFGVLGVNFMALVDLEANIIDGYTYDLAQQQEMPFPAEIQPHLQSGDLLVRATDDLELQRGLIATQFGPLLLISAPVLHSDGSGPAQGTLLVGRYLDAAELNRISGQARLPLSLLDYKSALQVPDFAEIAASLNPGNPTGFSVKSETEMSGFVLLSDLYGQPAYVLRAALTRAVAHGSQLVLTYLLITLVASVVLFGVITILSVDRLVLAPLHRLGQRVAQIGRRGDLSQRITVGRPDELGKLGKDINQMLADLQESQRRNLENEERFGRLVESMDDMIFTLDKDATEINVYGEKARSLGIPESIPLPGSLEVGMPADLPFDELGIALHFSAETLRNHMNALQLALGGQHLAYEWTAQSDGQEYSFQSVLSPMTDEGGRLAGVVGVARDISGMKRLENTLRQRVRDLNALNEVSRTFLSQLEAQTIFQESCRLMVENFGVDAAWVGILKEDDKILIPLAAQGLDSKKLPPLIAQGKTSPDQHPAVIALLDKEPVVVGKRTRSGAKIWAALAPVEREFAWMLALPVSAGESRAALVVFSRQNTAFPQAVVQLFQALVNLMTIALNNAALFSQVRADQARLQSLSQRLVDIQEDERRQIALELHDEIGQLLTGLKIQLDTAGSLPREGMVKRIERGRELADDLIKKVRNLSLDLRPSMLDDLGLLAALLWHIDRYTSLTGIKVNFVQRAMDGQRFSPNLETTAYRVVQEGLTNIARHAGVSEATVRAMYENQCLTIQIEDRGAGFSAADMLESGRSRGLLGMRERVAFVGGSFTIDSVPGWGTLLVVELPVPQSENGGSAYDHDPSGG